MQNKKYPLKRQVKEQLFVLSLLKPAVDSFRVASYSEHEEGSVMDARSELTIMKVVELVFEAIPGTFIQIAASLASGYNTSNTAWFSLFSSVATAAFCSSCLSWDWDSDKDNRKKAKSFYGYIPDR